MNIPVIIGPTASGKTGLSLEFAVHRRDIEIVSADSRQIFIGMDIGTAKPSPQERASVPHHLIDRISPDTWYSAGRFSIDAREAIEQIIQRGNLPVVVGGSGFYIKALFEGLNAPTADPVIYASLELRIEQEGYEALYAELMSVDPVSASAHSPNNHTKTLRALACFVQTGIPYSEFLNGDNDAIEPYLHQPTYLFLAPERPVLYERINNRVLEMLDAGLVAETEALLEQGYTASDHGLRTVGYKEVIAYRTGEMGYENMVAAIQQSTRRYAKRQMTWFRRLTVVPYASLEEARTVLLGLF